MRLIPVKEHLEENEALASNPRLQENLIMCVDFYKKVGFFPPWICYYAMINEEIVGWAGFKGKPMDGKVEIAYGTLEKFKNQGIATRICRLLVQLALKADPSLAIAARTLKGNIFSIKILKKNGFQFSGEVIDPEDGAVWEWIYEGGPFN
jgi:RimJ/RimL family protein N-acetyltransferase